MRNHNEHVTVSAMSDPADGSVRVPGSKSFTNRAIILAMAADGVSTLTGPLESDDTRYGLAAARDLGCEVDVGAGSVRIHGVGARRPVPEATLYVGSAGTVARFLPCLLAFGDPGTWRLEASPQMTARPMSGLLDALAHLGGPVVPVGEPGRYPLEVRGGKTVGRELRVDGSISSQYLSGLLLSAPLLPEGLRVTTEGSVVQSAYVDMTIDCMRHFGAEVSGTGDLAVIDVAPTGYRPADLDVEADASTASYFAALPAVVGGQVTLENLVRGSRQPDTRFVEIVEQFGCDVEWLGDRGVRVTRPRGLDLLRGGGDLDLRDCSDVALTVAAMAVFADAPVTVRGVEHIRSHESDRIAAMATALRAMGITVDERPDGWRIHPGSPRFAEVTTHDDHRVAMSLALVGLGGDGVGLDEPRCVDKTCPQFYDLIAGLGAEVRWDEA
ncbi:3-phosphoshikimate 1-carboxyvinyltransferase [Antribacter gilvus]|uniref:3-phosphoshikimate 1-carboxyvinyltransferase n=1 Tax=Antribacter gilvus TaxID=2304675 RepID=UPI000F786605|nr:3-phosphoshikimate 1-carboxyvinyltransferase [Antribacter gilvus]